MGGAHSLSDVREVRRCLSCIRIRISSYCNIDNCFCDHQKRFRITAILMLLCRYGLPTQVQDDAKEFAKFYIENWSVPTLTVSFLFSFCVCMSLCFSLMW